MKFYLHVPALVALAPALVQGYGMGGRFLTNPMVGVYTPGALIRRQRALANQCAFPRSSPRYEINDTDESFQLAVDVPGVEASDINVSIEDDVLTLSGERKVAKDSYAFASKFYQSFTLDKAIVTDEFKAELKNGVLYVTAPKDFKKLEENVKRIPVMQLTSDSSVEQITDKEVDTDDTIEARSVDAEEDPKDDDSDEVDLDEKTV